MHAKKSDSAPTVFLFQSTEVRTIDRDGQVWFVASDIAKALGYRDAINMTRVLDDDEADTHIMSTRSENGTIQSREVTIISESGLFHALLKSRKREAKPFRRWITQEVLPEIRRTGGYSSSVSPSPAVPAMPGSPGSKMLLTLEADGRYQVKQLAQGAMVATVGEIVEYLEKHGYLLVRRVSGDERLVFEEAGKDAGTG
ncbi:BRO-N domain-containing protein [Acidithiobacillus concretivorus]|uniref:Bro-N domain-containing protein n=1 Tax=Acidithiobacillus concretivorus TaxID=3063952 RepID=A0ABS5ZVW0_9PROT|nr:BRO family protein [Acidithiobacillus concretivorus]MBU2740054.1 hypothetical protein [Acidithiobacillus concretivorus]